MGNVGKNILSFCGIGRLSGNGKRRRTWRLLRCVFVCGFVEANCLNQPDPKVTPPQKMGLCFGFIDHQQPLIAGLIYQLSLGLPESGG